MEEGGGGWRKVEEGDVRGDFMGNSKEKGAGGCPTKRLKKT